jgi:hypothetical protein
MASADDFRRVDLGDTSPNFQGKRDNAQGPIEHQYQRFDTARNSDPSANLASSTWRPDQEPENLLDWQAQQVQQSVDDKLAIDAAFGLRQPIAGYGVHADKRDERNYGNVEPDGESYTPFRGER